MSKTIVTLSREYHVSTAKVLAACKKNKHNPQDKSLFDAMAEKIAHDEFMTDLGSGLLGGNDDFSASVTTTAPLMQISHPRHLPGNSFELTINGSTEIPDKEIKAFIRLWATKAGQVPIKALKRVYQRPHFKLVKGDGREIIFIMYRKRV